MTPPRDAFPRLREALLPFLDWIRTDALPFWGSAGVDWARGGFSVSTSMGARSSRSPSA
jgi:mannose/cellobiose epimerase-like protein (N-acyl-D-glucosamine 2-epimerase family)